LLWPENLKGWRYQLTTGASGAPGHRRRDLSKPYLVVDDETIQFNRDQHYWIDTEAFNTTSNTFTHTIKPGNLPVLRPHLQAASIFTVGFYGWIVVARQSWFPGMVVFHREQYLRYLLSALQTLSDYFGWSVNLSWS